MEIKVLIEAPELASAINSLAKALGGSALKVTAPTLGKDPASVSDTDMVTLPNGEDPNKYVMFQDLRKVALELNEMDKEVYESILYKYVAPGRQYSGIEAKDWGKAIKDFKEAIKSLKITAKEEVEEEEEDEDPKPKKPAKGKGKKAPVKEEPEEEDETEPEDDYEEEEEETEEPRLTVAELRALAARAKNAGVSVGPIMQKVAGVRKVSEIAKDKYNAFEDALKAAMEE